MSDRTDWFELHQSHLEDVARRSGLPLSVVQLAAALVLSGLEDPEIYPHLSDHLISMDGKRNPLAGARQALAEIRTLIDVSSRGDTGAW